jgi:phosphopantothenoylcysteine decarboxylase / phosphopantothenate---cysteine ligase
MRSRRTPRATSRPDVEHARLTVDADAPTADPHPSDGLHGRRVVVGVTGGIAAYKAALLVRRLIGVGAVVDVVMTRGARAFIGPVTFEGLTGRSVRSDVWEDVPDGTHVALGQDADAIVIYPATAHTLAKLANGLADDLLTTTALAHDGPLIVAPAMHTEMWSHPATAANLATLRGRGVTVVGPATGPLMGGDSGTGRVVEPEDVMTVLRDALAAPASDGDDASIPRPFTGRTLLVTAGGTREALDPVRFLGNRSSGRMGFAIARAAAQQGATVVLVTAPSDLPTPHGVRRVDVVSAQDMDVAVRQHEGVADAVVMAAAVADFRPAEQLSTKWRRTDGPPTIRLVANPDVLAGVVERRGGASRPVVVGFAAQTGDLEVGAREKLTTKKVELLVANDVSVSGIGFESDDNAVLILHRDGRRRDVPTSSKHLVAEAILAELLPLLG